MKKVGTEGVITVEPSRFTWFLYGRHTMPYPNALAERGWHRVATKRKVVVLVDTNHVNREAAMREWWRPLTHFNSNTFVPTFFIACRCYEKSRNRRCYYC